MQIVQREFYRSSRGPTPKDEDVWRLVFDSATKCLVVRHEWEASGHSGVDEFEIAEFLANERIAAGDKAAVMHGNAQRFYKLQSPAR